MFCFRSIQPADDVEFSLRLLLLRLGIELIQLRLAFLKLGANLVFVSLERRVLRARPRLRGCSGHVTSSFQLLDTCHVSLRAGSLR
jgi:hypothetical protein